TAGHAGAEVHAAAAEHDDDAAGHVFAAVVADALDDGERAGVAHAEAFAGAAGRVEFAAGRAVQARIADDDGRVLIVAGVLRRAHDDAAAGHALADAVVRLAVERDVQAARVPGAEALAGGAAQAQFDRCVRHALVAVAARDVAGQQSADRAVGV